MTDAEIVRAIRARHLKGNIGDYEGRRVTLHWRRALVDGLGGAPYVKLPITVRDDGAPYEVTIRVYPPARLAARLIKRCGYRWGGTWRTEPGPPPDWPKVKAVLRPRGTTGEGRSDLGAKT